MKITIITLFPKMFDEVLNSSILLRAQRKGKVEFELIDLREFGEGTHKTVDDRPYGGGAGMVLRADVLAKVVKRIQNSDEIRLNQMKSDEIGEFEMSPHIILTSASGATYTQKKARELSKLDHIVIICGHYEGVDQRFIDQYVDEEISIGNYVLTGGEIPAMVITDSIARLIPGVLEKEEATINESHEDGLLEHPHYTRPEEFEGLKVPEVLRSGNHKKISDWRKQKSIMKTQNIHQLTKDQI